jgi:aldehyde dehydrogenase (NAD+)
MPVQAEMGGCNATVVLPDADVDVVARDLVTSCFSFAGQKCTATQRVIVVGDPAPLVSRLRALMATHETGPVIDDVAQKRLVEAGCDTVDRAGYFVVPTLVETVDLHHQLLNEEVFGPIAAVVSVDSAATAFALADAGEYGLVTSVYTNDLAATLAALRDATTGLVRINQPTTGVDLHLPFGGQRNSSYGPREQGSAARDLYTWIQTVSIGAMQ